MHPELMAYAHGTSDSPEPDSLDATGVELPPVREVPPHVREAWQRIALAKGRKPTRREMQAAVGGGNEQRNAWCQALERDAHQTPAALAAGLPTGLPPVAPDGRDPVGDESDRALLMLTPRAAAALMQMRQTLRDNARLYHDCELFLHKLQRNRRGPLTDLLAALVGKEA